MANPKNTYFAPKQHVYIVVKDLNAKVIVRNGLREKLYDFVCCTTPDTIVILANLIRIEIITENEEQRGWLKGIPKSSFIFYDDEVEKLTEKILSIVQNTLEEENVQKK